MSESEMTQAKERPILFSSPMVQAILAGRKTQTRRPIVPQPLPEADALRDVPGENRWWAASASKQTWGVEYRSLGSDQQHEWRCPFGRPGARLWVREAWSYQAGIAAGPDRAAIIYRADSWYPQGGCYVDHPAGNPSRWRPSIHMPRWAARILLDVVEVRAQRVQEISFLEALDEGIPNVPDDDPRVAEAADGGYDAGNHQLARRVFRDLWDATYAKQGLGWDVNPWVWAVSFRNAEGGVA